MAIAGFPTSSDIYLEVDGVKVAVVQSYSARATKTSSTVEAFGEAEPVATVPGQTTHTLELTRLYATDEAIGAASVRQAPWAIWYWKRSASWLRNGWKRRCNAWRHVC